MEIAYATDLLEKMATDPAENGGFAQAIVKKYRQRVQLIKAAPDERDFYALKSLHYEKLKGKRSHQRSMRLNDQWRLVLEIKEAKEATDKPTVLIVGIEDYH